MGAVTQIDPYCIPEKKAENHEREFVVERGGDAVARAHEVLESRSAVRSLRSKEEINRFVTYFLQRKQYRDACIFVIGCNTGLRIGDILMLKWKDLDGLYKQHVVERKTQKIKTFFINEAMQEAITLYKNNLQRELDPDDFMFLSEGSKQSYIPPDWRKGRDKGKVVATTPQPLHTRSYSYIIRTAAQNLGLYTKERRISTHSMRKTCLNATAGLVDGIELPKYILDMKSKLELAQLMGNHGNVKMTMDHYVEIEDRLCEEVVRYMNLGLEAIQAYKESEK